MRFERFATFADMQAFAVKFAAEATSEVITDYGIYTDNAGLSFRPSVIISCDAETVVMRWNAFSDQEGIDFMSKSARREANQAAQGFNDQVKAALKAAQALSLTASDDIAFWTLEACKRPDVPLYNNLDIPADVAEDIDAANWSAGIGLKNTTARRELFREKRAEAYATMWPDHAAELAAEQPAAVEPFDAAKVKITRKRFSTTQGEVLVEYGGKRIEQYGDDIRLEGNAWTGRNDAYWMNVAKREAIARGMAGAATLEDFQSIGRGTRVIQHKIELIEQTPAARAIVVRNWPYRVIDFATGETITPTTSSARYSQKMGRGWRAPRKQTRVVHGLLPMILGCARTIYKMEKIWGNTPLTHRQAIEQARDMIREEIGFS
jgi:hypothetical protein